MILDVWLNIQTADSQVNAQSVKPPRSHVFEEIVLMAAEEGGDYE
jgi:hypothetical protein